MTFNAQIPNSSQSPAIFPGQSQTNFARLKTIINKDHVFNDTAAANDGRHRQVTLINRSDPGSVPSGTNSMVYGKSNASLNQLWFYDGTNNYQIGWRELSGTVNIASKDVYYPVVGIPANSYGTVIFFRDIASIPITSSGAFASNNTITAGAAFAEKYESDSGAANSELIRIANHTDASGLNLRVLIDGQRSNSYTGIWNYRIFYRPTS